jgi:hypothetical protein
MLKDLYFPSVAVDIELPSVSILPPPDFGNDIWQTDQFISEEPSSMLSDGSSVYSAETSIAPGSTTGQFVSEEPSSMLSDRSPDSSAKTSIAPGSTTGELFFEEPSSMLFDRSSVYSAEISTASGSTTGQFVSVEPSSPLSDRSTVYSTGTSIASGSTARSSLFPYSSDLKLERQRSDRSSILHSLYPSEPLSPLKVALTTRISVWKTRGPGGLLTKATMEGLIDYLLQRPAGERPT